MSQHRRRQDLLNPFPAIPAVPRAFRRPCSPGYGQFPEPGRNQADTIEAATVDGNRFVVHRRLRFAIRYAHG